MKTALARGETQMPEEDRIARIEITVDGIRKDVAEIKDDVKTLNIRLNDSIAANSREFGALRAELADHKTETEKNFGALRTELADHRTETEKNFGALRTELADHRTETEKNFGALRTENEKRFGALLVAIESSRTEAEKNLGAVRLEIEKVRTTIESAKFWLFTAAVGTILTLMGIVTGYFRAVKII